jgi:hypothetical protein
MPQRILNFLQAALQALLSARLSYAEQAREQVVHEQDAHIVSTKQEKLNETECVSMTPLRVPIKERTTEPYPAVVRLKRPAQRYRDLDIMLEYFKRDRLNNVKTELVPEYLHELARQLQSRIEEEERSERGSCP